MHYSNSFLFFFLFFFSTPDDPSEDHNIMEDLSVLLPAPNDPQFQPALEALQVSPCNCKRNNGQPCHTFFDEVEVSRCRLQYIGKTRQELDLVLLAKIESCVHVSVETVRQKKKSRVRERQRLIYRHKGFEICRNFFCICTALEKKKLKNLFKQYKENGVESRIHKSTKKQPSHALSFEDVKFAFNFIQNFAEANAIILPGRTPYAWKSDCKLLPTKCSRHFVYGNYAETMDECGQKKISLWSFLRIWNDLLPFIKNQKSATDLCWYCQQRFIQMQRSVNQPDSLKS